MFLGGRIAGETRKELVTGDAPEVNGIYGTGRDKWKCVWVEEV
jgi:hypothetical protein